KDENGPEEKQSTEETEGQSQEAGGLRESPRPHPQRKPPTPPVAGDSASSQKGNDCQRMVIMFCSVCFLKLVCFLHDANENIPEYPSVSFYLELLPNQEGATTVEQPEVIPLADDQEDKEG
ncbi:hypothetical protein PANDA_009910, partial [Ailuropoda melanoleuca]